MPVTFGAVNTMFNATKASGADSSASVGEMDGPGTDIIYQPTGYGVPVYGAVGDIFRLTVTGAIYSDLAAGAGAQVTFTLSLTPDGTGSSFDRKITFSLPDNITYPDKNPEAAFIPFWCQFLITIVELTTDTMKIRFSTNGMVVLGNDMIDAETFDPDEPQNAVDFQPNWGIGPATSGEMGSTVTYTVDLEADLSPVDKTKLSVIFDQCSLEYLHTPSN